MGYPWQIGDALFASELNAAIANAGSSSGSMVSVLDYGADPTGVADSSAAINAAASVAAPNGRRKSVYLPAGTYRVNHQINLTASQGMAGDTRGSSILYVDQAFSSTDTAVIVVTASSYDAGPVLRDFGITFQQPPDQGSRANFKTLAAGGTSGPGGTGVKYPWAIAAGSDSFRTQFIRLCVSGAWDGITTNGHNAVFYLEDIEMGALDCGVSLGEGALGVLDFAHMSGYHFWAFGLNGGSPLLNVFYDGQCIALRLGNQNGLDARGVNCFMGRVVFTSQASPGWFYFTNLAMDGDQATLEVADAFFLQIVNLYSTCQSAGTRPRVTINNGKVQIVNYYGHTLSSQPFIYTNGGYTTVNNVFLIHYPTDVPAIQVFGGSVLALRGGKILPAGGSMSVPLISQSGSASLQVGGLDLSGPAASTGVAVAFAVDSRNNSLSDIVLSASGWTVTIPAAPTIGYYGLLSGAELGSAAGGIVSVNVRSAANNQRDLSFLTANNLRWRMVVDASAETGSDAGANFSIARFHDAGGIIDSPLAINRASGVVTLGSTTIQGRVGFNNTAPFAKPTITGAKGGNIALASLLTALAGYGLVVDSTT